MTPGNAAANAGEACPRTLFHVFSTLNVGGPQVRFVALANRLGSGFANRVLAMDGRYESLKQLDAGAPCTVQELEFDKGRTARNFFMFRRLLRRLQPDALITYNWGAVEWGMANIGLGCPHIHIVDGFGPEEADRQLPRRVLFRRLVLSRKATTTVVPSKTLYDIVTRIWRLDPATVRYIPNGIDCARFDVDADPDLVRRIGLPEDATVVGTVAGLRPEKNLERLLRAFAAAADGDPALHLVIVGDGAERAALESRAASLGLGGRVIFTGYIADPATVLGLFDIFALSSDTEQMPISVLEAMAAGLPVAAVDVGDVRHIVSDANKPQIVVRDADALAGALSAFAADAALRRRIGDANRSHVRAVYDEDAMVAAYRDLFSV